MSEKIPFFDFFASFLPPRELRVQLHDAKVPGGSLNREKRTLEADVEAGGHVSDAARAALEHMLQQHGFFLRNL